MASTRSHAQESQEGSSAAESDAATEAGAETIMSMQDIVTECSAFSTGDARDLIDGAQVILKGNQNDVRNLCKPWGVQLKAQKRYRTMEIIKQELKTALTKRAPLRCTMSASPMLAE